jgi:NAD(P)-dependent dehydrogenase (short-subunit alcohol dehydrogenase family)
LTYPVLITGPSQGGIGAATAVALAAGSPVLLLLTGRSESKVTPAILEIHTKYPNVNVQFIHCDLASQVSVRSACVEISNLLNGRALDILICNAAIMACPYSLTPEGIESQFGTNHIGHFLLVNLLLPQVFKADNPRVVMVSSSVHLGGVVRFEDWNFDGDGEKGMGKVYNAWDGYGQSKLGNILFAKSLARIMEKRGAGKAFSLHPGCRSSFLVVSEVIVADLKIAIKSGLQVHMLAANGALLAEGLAKAIAAEAKHGRVFKREAPKTLDQGCATTLVAALDPSIDSMNGAYLVNGDVAEHALDEGSVTINDQDRLWTLSEQLVGEDFKW